MPVNFCPQCGTPRGDGRFCSNCAYAFDGTQPGSPVAVAPAAVAGTVVVPRLRVQLPDFVQKQLHPSEAVLGAFSASLFDHRHKKKWSHDKFALTSDRVLFFQNSWIHKEMDQMPYRSITGVQFGKGLRHGKVVIEAASVALTMDGISNDDAAFAEQIISGSIVGRKFITASDDRVSRASVGKTFGEAFAKGRRMAAEARERRAGEADSEENRPGPDA
jgi:hypothetical protein